MQPAPCLAFISLPGGSEWILILLVALMLFGSRLPAIMRGLGASVREFKQGMGLEEPERPAWRAPPPGAPAGPIARARLDRDLESDPPEAPPAPAAGDSALDGARDDRP